MTEEEKAAFNALQVAAAGLLDSDRAVAVALRHLHGQRYQDALTVMRRIGESRKRLYDLLIKLEGVTK